MNPDEMAHSYKDKQRAIAEHERLKQRQQKPLGTDNRAARRAAAKQAKKK